MSNQSIKDLYGNYGGMSPISVGGAGGAAASYLPPDIDWHKFASAARSMKLADQLFKQGDTRTLLDRVTAELKELEPRYKQLCELRDIFTAHPEIDRILGSLAKLTDQDILGGANSGR